MRSFEPQSLDLPDDKAEAQVPQGKKHGKNSRGTCVPVKDVGTTPVQAFEISDRLTEEAMAGIGEYNFQRSARKSIMLSLGVALPGGTDGSDKTTLDAYSKASDNACVHAYMCCLLGAGTFGLSRAIAKCGFMVGIFVLFGFCVLHTTICLRLAEVPQLIQCNVEHTPGLAKVFFWPRWARLFAILSIVQWYGASSFQVSSVVKTKNSILARDVRNHVLGMSTEIVISIIFFLALVFLSRKASAKDLQTKSWHAVVAMLMVGGIEVICAMLKGLLAMMHGDVGRHDLWYGEQILDGILDMVLAFGGMAILPYVLAEMLNPQNAKKVVWEATVYVNIFYMVIATTCYFGWGSDILVETPLEQLDKMDKWQPMPQIASRVMNALFIVKTGYTFPILSWALQREVFAFLELEKSPAVKLQLPWALQQLKDRKAAIKVVLVGLAFIPAFLQEETAEFYRTLFTFAVILIHMCFPTVFAALAVRFHQANLEKRPRCQSLSYQASETPEAEAEGKTSFQYAFGSLKSHIFTTHLTAVLVLIGSAFVIARTFWIEFSKTHSTSDATTTLLPTASANLSTTLSKITTTATTLSTTLSALTTSSAPSANSNTATSTSAQTLIRFLFR
eukprot:TRINITY_DN66354_c0_g1_i1.p1 TRINITY_DN66354_c0_g1~~TRINITY_DN66354_c0_g1_i1.p1  ORF type:complete len:618 (-),score=67.53 TRINITY_DN66354_c0_g1_i1:32-1885(-)